MTMTDIEILAPDDDLPPLRLESADSAPIRCEVDGCLNAVTKPARGRTPKKCDEHRNSPSTTSTKRNSWPMANSVESALIRYFNGLGMVVSFINPLDGTVIASGSEPVAHELVELGRQDKKLRALLEKIAAPGKYGPLMLAMAPVVIGIMANHNLLPQFTLGAKEGVKPNGDN